MKVFFYEQRRSFLICNKLKKTLRDHHVLPSNILLYNIVLTNNSKSLFYVFILDQKPPKKHLSAHSWLVSVNSLKLPL